MSSKKERQVPVQKAKKPSVTPKASGPKPIQAKMPVPLYHLIGKEKVAFVELASQLSGILRLTYGDEVTITKFGRILLELRGRNDLKGMVYLEQKTLTLFHAYEKQKQKMIEEQNLFKTSISTPPVQTFIAPKVDEIFNVESVDGASEKEGQGQSFLEGPAKDITPFTF
jgi:hypothetical protein